MKMIGIQTFGGTLNVQMFRWYFHRAEDNSFRFLMATPKIVYVIIIRERNPDIFRFEDKQRLINWGPGTMNYRKL